MATRVVHRVRCRKRDNTQMWADVKIVDAVTVITPSGTEHLLWTKAKDAEPCIIDKTGGPNQKGAPEACTRLSHMELATGQDDANQKMYIEVLDAVVFRPPTYHQSDQSGRGLDDNEKRSGLPKPATFGMGPYGLFLKEGTKFVVDKVGLDLAEGSPSSASRSAHVNLVTEKGNTDDGTDGIAAASDTIPPQKLAWAATIKHDAINFQVPGGDVCFVIPKSTQEEVDTTVLTTDPDTGDPCPPNNTDPNVYVDFPVDGDPNGASQGANVKIPSRAGGTKAIDQGPLWWIERVSPSFRPWFWYADINTPLAFSFFGSPGRLGSWGYRGFVLWNNYPVIWILSQNNALVPMGSFGSPSLDLCARIGDWDYSFPPVPSGTFLQPGRPPGSTVDFPFSGLSFVGAGEDSVEAGDQLQDSGVSPPTGGAFGPFGILQFTHPPLGNLPDAVPYGPDDGGGNLWDGRPNIYQLLGVQQPSRRDPTKPWDAFNNPYAPPSAKDAETYARQFEANWNTVADGHNGFIEGYVPRGGVSNGGASYSQPPGWAWAIQWFDGSIGHGVAGYPEEGYRASFQNGIPPGVATRFFPLEIYAPATAWRLKVDQLRPDWWDTNHLEFYQDPLNAFFPLVDPPFLWSNDPWTGTDTPAHPNPIEGP